MEHLEYREKTCPEALLANVERMMQLGVTGFRFVCLRDPEMATDFVDSVKGMGGLLISSKARGDGRKTYGILSLFDLLTKEDFDLNENAFDQRAAEVLPSITQEESRYAWRILHEDDATLALIADADNDLLEYLQMARDTVLPHVKCPLFLVVIGEMDPISEGDVRAPDLQSVRGLTLKWDEEEI